MTYWHEKQFEGRKMSFVLFYNDIVLYFEDCSELVFTSHNEDKL